MTIADFTIVGFTNWRVKSTVVTSELSTAWKVAQVENINMFAYKFSYQTTCLKKNFKRNREVVFTLNFSHIFRTLLKLSYYS